MTDDYSLFSPEKSLPIPLSGVHTWCPCEPDHIDDADRSNIPSERATYDTAAYNSDIDGLGVSYCVANMSR